MGGPEIDIPTKQKKGLLWFRITWESPRVTFHLTYHSANLHRMGVPKKTDIRRMILQIRIWGWFRIKWESPRVTFH